MTKTKQVGISKGSGKTPAQKTPELFSCSVCGRDDLEKADFYHSPARGRGGIQGMGKVCRNCEKNNVIKQNYRKMLRNNGSKRVIALRDRHAQLVEILNSVLDESTEG